MIADETTVRNEFWRGCCTAGASINSPDSRSSWLKRV